MKLHLNPSEVKDVYWLHAYDHDLAEKYPNQDGKWMMFFPMSDMDQRWSDACDLYYDGKLVGIHSLKASTSLQNPMTNRLHAHDEGIIIFYCGKSEDEDSLMRYGKNILSLISYPRTHFYYKSDRPHLIVPFNKYKNLYFIKTEDFYRKRVFSALRQLENNYNLFVLSF